MLVQFSSFASAEVYTWEDANGINFSDNPGAIAEKYREITSDENSVQNNKSAPLEKVRILPQKRPVITQKYQTAAAYQADIEQQRLALETIRQQQARVTAVKADVEKNTFPSLASLIVVWLIIALFLIVVWIVTIADIVRSDYITPSIKRGWMLLVIFIPLIGMLFYHILGRSHKVDSNSIDELQHYQALIRHS
jgi:hypothetical protein